MEKSTYFTECAVSCNVDEQKFYCWSVLVVKAHSDKWLWNSFQSSWFILSIHLLQGKKLLLGDNLPKTERKE